MSGIDIYTLEGTDDEYDQLIALLRLALNLAVESEVMHPETAGSIRAWCKAETTRLHPAAPARTRFDAEREALAGLRRSPHWPFWESLTKDQEVRWTGTKTATYFVDDPELVKNPDWNARGAGPVFIRLRRHTGKTFYAHIGAIRPLDGH